MWAWLKGFPSLLRDKGLPRGGVEATLLVLLVTTVGAIHFRDAILTHKTLIDPQKTEVGARYS